MAKIATCPKCAAQLGLPDSATSTDRLECPECQTSFLLGETIQIALPVARVLEPPTEAAPLTSAAPTHVEAVEATVETHPAKEPTSWESRLKNAIAADEPKQSETKKSLSEKPVQPSSPSFKFELETPAESPSEPLPPAPQKTLADFAANAESKTESKTLPKPVEIVLPTEVSQPVRAVQASVQTAVQTTVQRRIANRGFPKMAALVVGPVMGGVLGLYGLLWLQGEKADHAGLASVLPQSVLPAEFGDASPVVEQIVVEQKTKLAASRIKRDQAVQPATAYQPLTTRTTLQQFNTSVDAAEAALPAIMSGDLSAPESVKRKGQAYMALCRLAEHFDFAQQPGLAPQVLEKVRRAEQLYQHISADAGARQQLSHIASRWWDYQQRPSQGIFLMGQVQEIRQEMQTVGTASLCWIQLEGAAKVPVRIRHTRFQTGDFVGVVGKVVDRPKNSQPGVAADLEKIVEAEYSYKR